MSECFGFVFSLRPVERADEQKGYTHAPRRYILDRKKVLTVQKNEICTSGEDFPCGILSAFFADGEIYTKYSARFDWPVIGDC